MLRATVLLALTAVWLLLWGNLSAANTLSGLLVAVLITTMLPLPVVPVEGRLHPVSLLRLIVQIAWYLAESSVQVAWLAIRPGPLPPTGVLRAQLSIKSELVLVFAANIVTMLPGSVVLEIDQVRRILYCHVIDAGSERAIGAFHRQIAQVERLLVATFERDVDWRPAPTEEHT